MTTVFGVVVPDVCGHMKAIRYSETLESVYQTEQRYTAEDIYRIQKMKYYYYYYW
jgi:hypothetical protein